MIWRHFFKMTTTAPRDQWVNKTDCLIITWSKHFLYHWHLVSRPFWCLTVREITKSSSTFSATNISSNIVWLFQLHDTIQMKLNYTWIIYNHDNIAIRSHIMIYNCVWNLIFATKFSSISLAKGEKRLVFNYHFVNLQRAKDGTHMFDAKYRYVFVV